MAGSIFETKRDVITGNWNTADSTGHSDPIGHYGEVVEEEPP